MFYSLSMLLLQEKAFVNATLKQNETENCKMNQFSEIVIHLKSFDFHFKWSPPLHNGIEMMQLCSTSETEMVHDSQQILYSMAFLIHHWTWTSVEGLTSRAMLQRQTEPLVLYSRKRNKINLESGTNEQRVSTKIDLGFALKPFSHIKLSSRNVPGIIHVRAMRWELTHRKMLLSFLQRICEKKQQNLWLKSTLKWRGKYNLPQYLSGAWQQKVWKLVSIFFSDVFQDVYKVDSLKDKRTAGHPSREWDY